MPCERYNFDECVQLHGLDNFGTNDTDAKFDKKLLCVPKDAKVVEIISFASFAIVAYVICNCYIQIAEFRVMLKKSRIWGKGKAHEKEGSLAIIGSTVLCSCIGIVLYSASMVMVKTLVTPLDNRMNQFVVGISLIFSAIVFLMMSVHVPQWFGLYYSNKNTMVSYASARGIRVNLSWNIMKQLSSMFFFNLFFSCTDIDLSVLWGVLLGIGFGMFSIFITIQARSKKYADHQLPLAITAVLFYTFLSWFVFWRGTLYISEIWLRNPGPTKAILISLAWVAIMLVTHLLMYKWTNEKKSLGISMRFNSQVFEMNRIGSIVTSAFSKDDDESDAVDENKPEHASESEPKDEEQQNNKTVGFSEDTSEITRPNIAKYIAPEHAPDYWTLLMNKVVESYPYLCCCLRGKYGVESISQKRLDYVDRARERSTLGKFFYELKRFFWYLSSFACLFLTVVNIGATHQQCVAKNALPSTFELMYPPDYLTGTMCAWDAPGPNATIKTFDSLQDVYEADYKVIHCGACGTCSNWNDITLQYTSKAVLAGITKVCAKKSLGRRTNLSDPEDLVVKCNRELVGFTTPCAMSWAWDEINTKNNAVFVFIQANVANYFSDMEVTYQDITLATIDEAISGPRFVSEVGATRRRMNIISDISRPRTQQCTIINQTWSEIFLEPFKPPIGGTYKIQKPGQPTKTVVVIGEDSDPNNTVEL